MKKNIIPYLSLFLFFQFIKTEDINEESICNGKGIYEQNNCYCLQNYESINGEYCNYERKKKIVAIILSLFFGFTGADQYYLGKNIRGFLKVVLPVFLFFGLLFYIFINSNKPLNESNDIYFLIPIIILLFFWFIDFFCIINGITKDSKGFDLI
jgi:hypothetical protein